MARSKTAQEKASVDFLSLITDEDTHIAEEGKSAGENSGFMDTGCLIFNLQLSGSIYGGVPNNRITVFAGEEATGKTYLVRGILKNAMNKNPETLGLCYDTESAWAKDELQKSGIDTTRVAIADKQTIQEVTWHAVSSVKKYSEIPVKQRPPMIMTLDSLANLASLKELEDAVAAKDTRDMTKSQLIRGMFRKLNLPLAKARIPWLICNHTYDSMSPYEAKKQSGGGGVAYNASMCMFLSKSKDKDDKTKEVLGNIIKSTSYKNRFAKQWTQVEMKLNYADGLDPYYGLLDQAVRYKLSEKMSGKYQMIKGEGEFYKEKDIYRNPEDFFTKDWLNKFEEVVSPNFRYGIGEAPSDEDFDNEEEVIDSRKNNLIESFTQ